MYNNSSYFVVTKKKIVVKRLIWDEWNFSHIARHDITPEEVQEACNSDRIEREA